MTDKTSSAMTAELWNDDLIEILAAIEHERWSSWMRWMFDNWKEDNISRWRWQMVTPYPDLPEHSKESDRKEVKKTLMAIQNFHDHHAAEATARAEKAEEEFKRLREALKRLSFMAQTSGGTAGRDDELMAAIAHAQQALTPESAS